MRVSKLILQANVVDVQIKYLTTLVVGERELGEWKTIFQQADERFTFKGASQPEGSTHWILEAEWSG